LLLKVDARGSFEKVDARGSFEKVEQKKPDVGKSKGGRNCYV